MSLTGIREVDHKILNNLDDKSLVNFCQTDKKADEYCNDQTFWMNRILTMFPYLDLDLLRKYKGDRSWSEYYILDLRKNLDYKKAIANNRLDHIKILLEKGVASEDRDKFIQFAVYGGRLTILKYLLSKGFVIKDINLELRNALHLSMIKYLVSLGADIHNNYQAILRVMNRVRFGFHDDELLKIIKYLDDIGENIHFDDEFPLRLGARHNKLDVVKYLIEHGANIHADDEGALRSAVSFGNLDIVKYLVEQGADIHFEFDFPVRQAHLKGYTKIVEYLVSQGASDPRIY